MTAIMGSSEKSSPENDTTSDDRGLLSQGVVTPQEYQRRLRNVLGQVRSVARRTSDTAETMEDYLLHLDSRLDALLKSQAMAAATMPVALEEAVMEALLAFDLDGDERISIAGPGIDLSPTTAGLLGLTFHELVMQALLYGALQEPDGRVTVEWSRAGDGTVTIAWDESGAALDPDSKHFSFARDLICEMLPYEIDASSDIKSEADRLRCEVRIPLAGRDGWRVQP